MFYTCASNCPQTTADVPSRTSSKPHEFDELLSLHPQAPGLCSRGSFFETVVLNTLFFKSPRPLLLYRRPLRLRESRAIARHVLLPHEAPRSKHRILISYVLCIYFML